MKAYMEDVFQCFIIGLKIFIGFFIAGVLIGLIRQGFKIHALIWGCKVTQIVAAMGLGISALGFMKMDLLRPLDYEDKWKLYFNKFNLVFAILFISTFVAIISYILEMFIQ